MTGAGTGAGIGAGVGMGAAFGRTNALASISCVRSGGLIAGGAAADGAAADGATADGGCGTLGMSCVPGIRFCGDGTDGGGGGLVPVPDLFVSSDGIAPAAACWNAPRCDSALLTASGDTCDATGTGSGAEGAGAGDAATGGGP